MASERPTRHDPNTVSSDKTKTGMPQPATVKLDGVVFHGPPPWTRNQIADALDRDRNTVSSRITKLEQSSRIQPEKTPSKREKFYSETATRLMLRDLQSIKQRLKQPEPNGKSNTGSEGEKKPENFFTFLDGTKIEAIGPKQKALLELITQKANDEKPTTLSDMKERGIINDKTSPKQLNTLLALLRANLEEQTSWRLTDVSYINPDTQKDVFAITLRKIEPNKDRALTKDQRLRLKQILPKYAVIDLLNEIIELKTDISYNVRVRLGKYLVPYNIKVRDIFGDVSDQTLNDEFMGALKSAFGKTKKSQPDSLDLKLQQKAQSIRQNRPNVANEIDYIGRRLASTVIKTEEKE